MRPDCNTPVIGQPWERRDRPEMIYAHLGRLGGGKVLSLGCGNGYVEATLAAKDPRFYFRCVDKNPHEISFAQGYWKPKGIENIGFEVGNNEEVADENLSSVIKMRTPGGGLMRPVSFLRKGGLLFYEGIAQWNDQSCPQWSEIFPPDMDNRDESHLAVRREEAISAGTRLVEERKFYSVKFYEPNEMPDLMEQFFSYRNFTVEDFQKLLCKTLKKWHRWLGTDSPEFYPLGYVHTWNVFEKI
ncbi:MAG: methyltransferase [Candidatus Aenigmarchaeota archaeon]|nr:methyltransferase [Candidatus Aenigmarchaeota archaeon]